MVRYLLLVTLCGTSCAEIFADDKPSAVTTITSGNTTPELFRRPVVNNAPAGRMTVTNGDASVPVVVVRGTPYEMGRQLGEAMKSEIQQFVLPALAGIAKELQVTEATLCEVWARSAA